MRARQRGRHPEDQACQPSRNFFSDLAQDPNALGGFILDPEAAMEAAELDEEDRKAMRSGFTGVIYARMAGMTSRRLKIPELLPGARRGRGARAGSPAPQPFPQVPVQFQQLPPQFQQLPPQSQPAAAQSSNCRRVQQLPPQFQQLAAAAPGQLPPQFQQLPPQFQQLPPQSNSCRRSSSSCRRSSSSCHRSSSSSRAVPAAATAVPAAAAAVPAAATAFHTLVTAHFQQVFQFPFGGFFRM